MKPIIFLRDLRELDDTFYILVSKIVSIYKKEKYFILQLLLPDGLLNAYYFDKANIPKLYGTYLIILRVVNTNDNRKFYRIFTLSELDYLEELFWRKVILDKYIRLRKKIKISRTVDIQQRVAGKKDIEKHTIEPKKPKEEEMDRDNVDIVEEISCDYNDMLCMRKAILNIVDKLDSGEGVSIDEIRKILDAPTDVLERIIAEMLMAGELYEYSPGKLKILK